MAWMQYDTAQAAEAASKSFDDVEVPVGKWKAVVDDIYEAKKDGEHYYCKFSGERKALMKLEVIDGRGQEESSGRTFLSSQKIQRNRQIEALLFSIIFVYQLVTRGRL